MEIFTLYQTFAYSFVRFMGVNESLLIGLLVAFVVWLALFILQGVGLFVMAKKRGIKRRALAFVPFANIWLMGKMAGTCDVFGHPIKRAGLYTMLAQIFITLFSVASIAAELYLYIGCGMPQISETFEVPYWGLTGFAGVVESFYEISMFIYSIPLLIYKILMMILLMGLLKQYSPKNYSMLAFVTFLLPEARFIAIFVLRNRKAIDYEAYMRARREAYMRQRQQYYNQYGNPYGYGNSYGNPHGNPYHNAPQNERPTPPEEPFAEFGSTTNANDEKNSTTDGNDDDFFN